MAYILVEGPDPTNLPDGRATMKINMLDQGLLLVVQAMCTAYNYQGVIDNPAYNPNAPTVIVNPDYKPQTISNPDYVPEMILNPDYDPEKGNEEYIPNPEYAGAPQSIPNPEYDPNIPATIANPDYQAARIANPVGPGTFALQKTVEFWMGHGKSYAQKQGETQGGAFALEQVKPLSQVTFEQIE